MYVVASASARRWVTPNVLLPPQTRVCGSQTSVALEQLQQQAQDMEGSNEFRVSASSSKKRRVEEGRGQPVAAAAAQEAQDWCPQGSSEEANGRGEADSGGKLRGWAPPGLGVCQLWAQQASSLKKKKGKLED